MKDDFSALENAMKAMKPKALSSDVKQNILAEIAKAEAEVIATSTPAAKVIPFRLWWGLTTAAAMLLVGVFIGSRFFAPVKVQTVIVKEEVKTPPATPTINPATEDETPEAVAKTNVPHDEIIRKLGPNEKFRPDEYKPTSVNTVVVNRYDEGIVKVSADKPPMRRVRLKMLDHTQYRNKHNNKEYRVTTPREKVIYLPVESL